MSVLIKGMDMPINCQHCPFSDDESRFCKAAKKYIPMLGKPQFCPLVEVNPCDICEIAKYHNLEDDDSPCRDCEEEEEDDR